MEIKFGNEVRVDQLDKDDVFIQLEEFANGDIIPWLYSIVTTKEGMKSLFPDDIESVMVKNLINGWLMKFDDSITVLHIGHVDYIVKSLSDTKYMSSEKDMKPLKIDVNEKEYIKFNFDKDKVAVWSGLNREIDRDKWSLRKLFELDHYKVSLILHELKNWWFLTNNKGDQ